MQRDQLFAGRYRLASRLGRGGMSIVWQAHDEVLERDVAVKVLTATDPGARWRIRAEAKAAARSTHPNLTSVYDFGESSVDGEPLPFVVMELLTGTTLARRLAAGPLPTGEALRVCADVAAGLAAAHARNLVHRDVKPANVMLTPAGAKLLDFGIAAGVGAPEIDAEGRILGTPAYAAPERVTGGTVSPAIDVYALGLLLYDALVGRPPAHPDSRPGSEADGGPEPLPDLDGVPAEVDRLYRRCLATDPADRPTAAEAARILAAALAPASGVGTAGPSERPASAVEVDRSTYRPPSGEGTAGPPERSDPPAAPVREPLPPAPERPTSAPARRAGYGTRLLVAVAAATIGAVAVANTLGNPPAPRADPTGEPEAGHRSAERSSVALPVPAEPSRPSVALTTAAAPTAPAASATSTPAGTPSTPSTPTVAPTWTPSTGTGSSTEVAARGGTVAVRCDGKLAEVTDVVPAAGFRLGPSEPGPARRVRVELVAPDRSSVITVRCANGRPVATVQEDPAAAGRVRAEGRPAVDRGRAEGRPALDRVRAEERRAAGRV
ncbi:protein kinase [Micromonospora sp. NPDC126480]|uniref:serine/threonine-protein kinase n=1 Tax=Micromonospora sp. NPDC126480 TaxID=3155312 RepID=UPI00332C2D92